MRSKIKLLFALRSDAREDTLRELLSKEIDDLKSASAGAWFFVTGYAVRDADLLHIAAGAFDAAERPFDAMLEIVVSNGELAAAVPLFEGLAGRLIDVIDPAYCAALAGTEHMILPGDGPLFVLIANRRLPEFSHEGFIDYWLGYHGPFARTHTPPDIGMGYRQFHTDEANTARLLQATGFGIGDFDGAAECHYPDAKSVKALMARTDVVDQATEDERKFVDHDRCVTSLFKLVAFSNDDEPKAR